MGDEAPPLRAIYVEPDDDAPRLAYADWLGENGQPERAETDSWVASRSGGDRWRMAARWRAYSAPASLPSSGRAPHHHTSVKYLTRSPPSCPGTTRFRARVVRVRPLRSRTGSRSTCREEGEVILPLRPLQRFRRLQFVAVLLA